MVSPGHYSLLPLIACPKVSQRLRSLKDKIPQENGWKRWTRNFGLRSIKHYGKYAREGRGRLKHTHTHSHTHAHIHLRTQAHAHTPAKTCLCPDPQSL